MKTKNLLFLCLLTFIFSFSLNCTKENTKIPDNVILKTGSVEITQYEFEKNLNRYKRQLKKTTNPATAPDSIRQWISNYVDNSYLLARAYDLNYHKRPDILEKVDVMARYILTKYRGPVYQKLITKNINISETDIAEAYEKRREVLDVKLIKFTAREDMLHCLGADTLLKTPKQFETAVAACKNYENVKIEETQLPWPLPGLWQIQDEIFQLQTGDISTPLYTDRGIYIIHVLQRRQQEPEPFDEIKDGLRKMLSRIEEKQLAQQKDHETRNQAQIVYQSAVLDSMMTNYDFDSENGQINTEPLKPIWGQVLLSYRLKGETIERTVADFVAYYHSLPMRRHLKDRNGIVGFLDTWVIDDYLFQIARDTGKDQEKKFLLDRNNYLNRLVLHDFIKQEIADSIQIADTELKKWYTTHPENFIAPVFCQISVLYFSSFGDAYQSKHLLLQNNVSTVADIAKIENQLIGLKKWERSQQINWNSTKFPSPIMRNIFETIKTGGLTDPVLLDPDIIIVILKKSEHGTRTKPFAEIHDNLKQHMLTERVKMAKIVLIAQLKHHNTIKNRISPEKYVKFTNNPN